MKSLAKWVSVIAVAIALGFFGGVQSELANLSREQGKRLVTFLSGYMRVPAPGSLVRPETAKTIHEHIVSADNWAGVWKILPDDAFTFVTDDGKIVQWFFESPCCTHAFIGKKKAGVASGTLIRRVKANGCITEYEVDNMLAVPGENSHLSAHYMSHGAAECDVSPQDGTKTFARRW